MRGLNIDHHHVPPLALAIIAGLLVLVVAGRGHGPSGVKTTLHCADFAATTPHHGDVRLGDIRGAGTSCAQVRRVLAAWIATDLRATGELTGGFRCGFDRPTGFGSTGGCRRSARVGVRFDIRFV